MVDPWKAPEGLDEACSYRRTPWCIGRTELFLTPGELRDFWAMVVPCEGSELPRTERTAGGAVVGSSASNRHSRCEGRVRSPESQAPFELLKRPQKILVVKPY